jgi:hypothetical protein
MNVAGQATLTRNTSFDLLKVSTTQLNAGENLSFDAMTALKNLESSRRMVLHTTDPSAKARLIKQMSNDMQQILAPTTPATRKSFTKTQSLQSITPVNNEMSGMSLQKKLNKSIYQTAKLNKMPQAGVMKYRLDSIVNLVYDQSLWLKESKQAFDYNYNGKLTKNSNFEYFSEGDLWINDDESKIIYDDKGRMTGYVSKSWNNEVSDLRWILNDSILLSYDAQGNKILDERYYESFIPDSGKFMLIGDYKNEYQFNANNEEIGSIYYTWDLETGEWLPDSKNEYFFQDGMELMFSAYMWDAELDMWIGHWKFEHFPVPEYNVMGSIYYGWNDVINNWYVNSKEEYQVGQDVSGAVVTSVYYQADYETMVLYPTTKTVFSEPGVIGHNIQESFKSIINYSWNPIDSIWVNSSKTRNNFDTFGNIVLSLDSIWATNSSTSQNEWFIDHKTENTVNAAGYITETLMTDWGFNMFDGTNSITGKDRVLYVYNPNNELSERSYQKWEFSNDTWTNISRYTYEYDTAGNITSEYWYENYIPETETWIPSRKFEYVFNGKGDQVSYAYYVWIPITESWRLGSKNEYEEDDNGEVILESQTSWNESLNKEVINYKYQKVYDSNGNLTMEINISSNTYFDGTQFYVTVYGEKQEYVYDANNKLTSQIDYKYINDVFVEDEKIVFVYDSTHPAALATETTYRWNAATSGWDLYFKGELTYNFEVPNSEILLPFGEEEDGSREVNMYFNFMPLEFIGSDWNVTNSDWVLSEKTIVYFTQSEFSSTEDISSGKWLVYPNPVSDFVAVKLPVNVQQAQFKLFDIQGRMINEKVIRQDTLIDLSEVVNGIYFYQIATGMETIKGKLIKK